MIDSMDIIFTRTGDDIEWTTLVSWSRKNGYDLLPELPPDIMAKVLDSIAYLFWEEV